jgi:hypothetical protein
MASEPPLRHLDPYAVLGIDRFATPAEIKAAYRRAIRSAHPDLAAGATGATAAQVNTAYETLSRASAAREPLRPSPRTNPRTSPRDGTSRTPPQPAPRRPPVDPSVWGEPDQRVFVARLRLLLAVVLIALGFGLGGVVVAALPNSGAQQSAVLGTFGPLVVFAFFCAALSSPVARVPEFLLLGFPAIASLVLATWTQGPESKAALLSVFGASVTLIAIDVVARLLAHQYRIAREANAWQNLINLNHANPGSEIIWAPGLSGLAASRGAWICFAADDRTLGRAPARAIVSFGMLARRRDAASRGRG